MAKRGSRIPKKGKKKSVSVAKKRNILEFKMAKRGQLTPAQKEKKKKERKEKTKLERAKKGEQQRKRYEAKIRHQTEEEAYPLSAEVTGEEMLKMMDKGDLQYLTERKRSKKRKRTDENDNEKEEIRRFKEYGREDVRHLLPYKTPEGKVIKRYTTVEDEENEGKEDGTSQTDSEDDEMDTDEEEPQKEIEKRSAISFFESRQKKLDAAKVRIGCLAVNFLEAPQERLTALSSLINLLDEPDPEISVIVKKYTALSLLKVFNSIIPSYRIVVHDLREKLKKVTKQVYFYENTILKGYQFYLKGLESMVQTGTKKNASVANKEMAVVALKCMGELLCTHPHFNYRENLIHALVPFLTHRDDSVCSTVASYITQIFRTDKEGHISLEVVKRIDHLVRKRSFITRTEVFTVFLKLRVKNTINMDEEIAERMEARRKLTHQEKLIRKVQEENRYKKSKREARIFRKTRKLEEQKKTIIAEQATKQRNEQHAKIIQTVFGLYIHVLKRKPNKKLNEPVLEGLATFAHLVNIEFFGDLLNVLGDLMDEEKLNFRESLLCIQTVFTILSGQGEVLTLDPKRFYTYLYANMLSISAGAHHEDVTLVLESLKQMLLQHRKRVSALRVQAYSKRLSTLCLTLLHNGIIASLAILRNIMIGHTSAEALLETDAAGTSGVFSPEIEQPELSNAAASCLWELHHLTRHYHPVVQQMSRHLLAGAPLQGNEALPFSLTKGSAMELFSEYDPSDMCLKPSIPDPSHHLSKYKTTKKAKRRRVDFCTPFMQEVCENVNIPG